MIHDILRITLLYDFYSELLTDKQRVFIDMYYFNDLTLNEIGEQFGITPQGVRDLVKRTEKLLAGYESKLLLVEKFLLQKSKIDDLIQYIEGLDALDSDCKRRLKSKIHTLIE